MRSLQNPFEFAASDAAADTAVASLPHAPAPGAAATVPDDLKNRMLAAIEEDYRFSLDKEKFLFDIGCVPEDFDKYIEMMDALTDNDEPPLFIQQQMRA